MHLLLIQGILHFVRVSYYVILHAVWVSYYHHTTIISLPEKRPQMHILPNVIDPLQIKTTEVKLKEGNEEFKM